MISWEKFNDILQWIVKSPILMYCGLFLPQLVWAFSDYFPLPVRFLPLSTNGTTENL